MVKVFRRAAPAVVVVDNNNTIATTAISGKENLNMILTESEANDMRRILEKHRQSVMDSIDGCKELSLQSLLDDMGCDDEVAQALLV